MERATNPSSAHKATTMKSYKLPMAPALPAAALLAAAFGFAAPGSAPAWTPPVPLSSGVGDLLPVPELEDFMQTDAKSFADYKGRAVLIEFFEHW